MNGAAMPLQGHSPLSLEDCGDWERFLSTRTEQMSLLSLIEGGSRELWAGQPHLCPWTGDRATNPGNP